MTTPGTVNVALVPISDQIACIEREIGYRLKVYARRVAEGKMTQQLADRELDRMRAVRETLKRVALDAPILGDAT